MNFLNINLKIWLKAVHVFSACIWFGAVLSVIIIYLNSVNNSNLSIAVNNNLLMEKLDYYLIIPFSITCYLSGLLISWKTNWGFMKYKWIFVKLIIGTLLMLFGIFFLNNWIVTATAQLQTNNLKAFEHTQHMLGISMICQSIFIAFLIFISNLKPWGKMKKN